MAKATDNSVKAAGIRKSRGAILLELDNTAVNGRQLIFTVLKRVLEDKDITMTPVIFAKHCLQFPVRQYVPTLLHATGKTRLSPEKLTAEIVSAIKSAFLDKSLSIQPGALKLLKLAAERGVKVGMISAFDAETARKLVANLGLGDIGPNLYPCYFEEKGCPGADAWLMLVRNINVVPSQSVVVATSGITCKCALSAGMRCIVVPDKYTSFHDFSGADFVHNELNNDTIEAVFALLERH
ncbi:MAG: hypothetical protein C0404_08735 [Verrucomicrobia bacterium]|nr:hypothetical protein [Verrucomicrobiota bacterium]